ncbi:MAG TPA: glycosyltransferase [bacterium]|nr:glycosyltransferase [bacterium]
MLLISYWFPPVGGTWVMRAQKLAKYLPRYGWEPVILCARNPHETVKRMDMSLFDELPTSLLVYRARSPEPLFMLDTAKRFARRAIPAGTVRGRRALDALDWRLDRWYDRFSRRLVPDPTAAWMPWAGRLGRRIITRHRPAAILSTAPPYSNHIVAMRLKRESGLPWIADWRDLWTLDRRYSKTGRLRRREEVLERSVLKEADAVTGILDEINASHIGLAGAENPEKFHTIPHGFDPDDFHEPPLDPAPGKWNISYAGTFTQEIRPGVFLDGVRHAVDADARLAEKLRVNFIGSPNPELAWAVAERKLEPWVAFTGFLPHRRATRTMMGSDLLLLVLGDVPRGEMVVSNKIFEYLASRRPILALVSEGAAAEVIRATGAGLVVSPPDPAAVAAAITAAFHGKGAARCRVDASKLDEYDRSLHARKFAEILDGLTGRET